MKPIHALLWALTIMIFMFCAIASNGAERQTVNEYVGNFLKMYPKRKERALALMPYIKEQSQKNGVDHRIVVVMITKESAWKTSSKGKIGEIGLMQVHGICAKVQNLSTSRGQIKAGIECLERSKLACDGSDEQMVTMYASGKCKSDSKRTQRLVRQRLRIARRLKND